MDDNKSEKYAAHQGLFDTRFSEIIIKTFVGFERSTFDQLSQNDEQENGPIVSVYYSTYTEGAAQDLIDGIETGRYQLPEGTSLVWEDGTPLPEEPEGY